MEENVDSQAIFDKMKADLNEYVHKLEKKIRTYGSFNVIANTSARNHFRFEQDFSTDIPGTKPTTPEYVALICLKFPFSLGIGEFSRSMFVAEDFYEINELANKIIDNYTFIHLHKYKVLDKNGGFDDAQRIAQSMSADELLVRNETFESFHWDQLEDLYADYDDYFKDKVGLTVKEAVRLCLTIHDYVTESFKESITRTRKNTTEMYEEIMAYKYRNKMPSNFYPPEYLERFKITKDEHIKNEFLQSMMTYEMAMLGNTLSFTAKEIAEMEELDVNQVSKFLHLISLRFGEIEPDFSQPKIIHPLKSKPLIEHEGKFICPSISLLDYSLDNLFSELLQSDIKQKEKYKKWRHDFLLSKGMEYISSALKPTATYVNLTYPGGEMDGLLMCDSNLFFVEAKSHKVTDRAKRGFIDRIENDIKSIIKGSYTQAIRTYNYLFGKDNVLFKNERGQKITIDAGNYKNAYFITLTLEDFSAISINLKVNNSFGLFNKDAFPWIVSLYNLRMVCEHMEGPAYFIQYLHRRKEFFKYEKFMVLDEVDILGHYLKVNLRFDHLVEKIYDNRSLILLPSYLDEFNAYYLFKEGKTKKQVLKMVHYSAPPIKTLVKALEHSQLPYSVDAGTQLLELGTKTKKDFVEYVRKVKKRYAKDNYNHDFRIAGDDVNDKTWMFSYWIGPNQPAFIEEFQTWVSEKFKEEPSNTYIAILDVGKREYQIAKILHLQF